jgi:RNA polymerase sigma-70 factor (ECF subfamily)
MGVTETLSDRDAVLYTAVRGELIAFATGLVGRCDAEDVVSAAVLSSIRSPSWPQVENRRAYLYRAVVNEAQAVARRDAQRRRRDQHAAGTERWDLPDFHPEVLQAVDALSVRQRAVVLLTYWADLPPSEVADRLGIAEGSVRRHLARARARLRKALR